MLTPKQSPHFPEYMFQRGLVHLRSNNSIQIPPSCFEVVVETNI